MQKQPRGRKFVHLHVHSEHSIMESTATIRQIVDTAVKHQMPAIALTDYNSLAGAAEFDRYARQRGIKPVFGCEVFIRPDERSSMTGTTRLHLTLLARSRQGWRNLCELTKSRLIDGSPVNEIEFALLEKHSAGLIALSGCLAGEVARCLLADDREAAKLAIARYIAIFGTGNFYIELHNHGLPEQQKILPELVSLADECGCPVVATNDIHYISRKDHVLHDAMLCLRTGARIADRQRFHFPTREFYCRSTEEMRKAFEKWPQALAETVRIADRCNVSILPEKVAAPEPLAVKAKKPDAELAEMCQKGLIRRFGSLTPDPKTFDRLQAELAAIKERGLSGMFVTIAEMVAAAQAAGIRTWPGAGKACASLVNYLLGITDVNPMQHGLIFATFFNGEDRQGPHFNILCSENRQFMVTFLQKRFGSNRIVNTSRCRRWYADHLIREIGKIIDVHPLEPQRVISTAIEAPGKTLREKIRQNSTMHALAGNPNRGLRNLIQLAAGLENRIREILPGNTILISPVKIEENLPVFKTEDGTMTTQFDSYSLSHAGFFLVDIAELDQLAINRKTAQMTGREPPETSAAESDQKNHEVFRLLRSGATHRIHRLGSSAMRSIIGQLLPNCFNDMILMHACLNEGPITSGLFKQIADRRNGVAQYNPPHPDLQTILQETCGLFLYHEQIIGAMATLAGFSAGEACDFIAAVRNDEKTQLSQFRRKFIRQAGKRGAGQSEARQLFCDLCQAAQNAVSKAQATAEAALSWQGAWLMASFPDKYLTAARKYKLY